MLHELYVRDRRVEREVGVRQLAGAGAGRLEERNLEVVEVDGDARSSGQRDGAQLAADGRVAPAGECTSTVQCNSVERKGTQKTRIRISNHKSNLYWQLATEPININLYVS